MFLFNKTNQKIVILFMTVVFGATTGYAQKKTTTKPVWWFGQSVAANFNTYRGTTQMLNNNLTVPTAFHKGNGVKPYFSLLTEYRPNNMFGGMLNIAFDNRGGKFDEVMAPCDCPANLSTNLSYVTIEPSFRIAPFSNAFYLFAGPTISFNVAKKFNYEQEKQVDRAGEWSDIKKTVFSAQVGTGIDIPISAKTNPTQFTLSPFVAFHTDLGREPRTTDDWSFYTIRTGIALKFGTSKKDKTIKDEESFVMPVIIPEKKISFSVRAPKAVPSTRQVKETFPLRNSVFFDIGSDKISPRYVLLNKQQAASFKEEQLQEQQPSNLNRGRSSRQLSVYHNIMNIMGDRLRANPESRITLTGAAEKNPAEGKIMAENIKQYLVDVFGIDPSRITTAGRDKPLVPSEQPGGTKELVLLQEGNRRVDIESTSTELLLQVGGVTSPFFKPVQMKSVQVDPLDSHVIFNAANAEASLKSWSVDVTDEKGQMQRFGPYTKDQASIPGKSILGNNEQGNYQIVMNGETKDGRFIQEKSSVSLVKAEDPKQEGLRYSILFDYDKSKSVEAYEKFLTDIVMPLIPDYGTVIIHGHTDIIGDENYNSSLSHDRATGTQKILERALSNAGKKSIRFETFGFGEDASMSPFENDFPEERFYNRTVIIDIIPGK